ncbi:MAG TPA: ferrous iron transport protein B, partial [Methanosarcinales archaeon]|nr:ferrous iron transport protein B [Methanosarcinales archaeon]
IMKKVVLAGNPNVGKSVIFTRLTGKYITVSNYPGTTVEVSSGRGNISCGTVEIIDTPGAYSLIPMSEDERVARDVLIEEDVDVIIHVADAKNLKRTLLIASQLLELNKPMILDLNMFDETDRKGINIDIKKLSEILGIEVIKTIATDGRGIKDLKNAILKAKTSNFSIKYNEKIEKAISDIESIVGNRSISIMLLSGDQSLNEMLKIKYGTDKFEKIKDIIKNIQSAYKNLSFIIQKKRQEKVEEIVQKVMTVKQKEKKDLFLQEKISNLTMETLTGIPILIGILYLLYKFVGVFGAGIVVDFIESTVFGEYFNPWITNLLKTYLPVEILQDMLVGKYGLITVGLTYSIAIVLPIVGTFFIAFGILEDSGYFPRLTIMSNRVFKKIGLSGKAVLPMVLGLGCDTMATLTTRILENRKERVIATLLLALGVPCSAQLGVVLGILASFSAKALFIVFGVVAMQMLLVGYLASKIIPGERSDFIMEIPPLRVPQISNVLTKTYIRMEWFLFEAVPLFLLGTFLLFLLYRLDLLTAIQSGLQPIVTGMLGLPRETTEPFLMGFLRRDYGAAGLYKLAENGLLTPVQIVVSLVVITLFVPCIANFFVMIKERGLKTALAIVAFIFPYALLVGTVLNFVLRILEIKV